MEIKLNKIAFSQIEVSGDAIDKCKLSNGQLSISLGNGKKIKVYIPELMTEEQRIKRYVNKMKEKYKDVILKNGEDTFNIILAFICYVNALGTKRDIMKQTINNVISLSKLINNVKTVLNDELYNIITENTCHYGQKNN